MSAQKFGDKLKELDLTHEEIDRFTKCMKDEKFRDLLKEYAEEISDPENRKRYEEEIAQLERDRGMDVKFINPTPGHVLKTSIDGDQKCFINICTNENLGQPKSKPSMQGNTKGMQWSIPHSVSQAREDVDKAGTKCVVYDVVFHPDTYYLLQKNARFKKMIHDTALDAVERQFGVKLDKVNVKTPKMSFKGLPMSSVIRTPHPNGASNTAPPKDELDAKLRPPLPPVNSTNCNGTSANSSTSLQENLKKHFSGVKDGKIGDKSESHNTEADSTSNYTKPNYTITHRGHFDIQDYRVANDTVQSTMPKELVINIDLPLLHAANSVNLEIFEKQLLLESEKPAKYKLNLVLPYRVAENEGSAKFDKSRHRLAVTLEVLPPPTQLLHAGGTALVTEMSQSDQAAVEKEDVTTQQNCDLTSDTSRGSAKKVGVTEVGAKKVGVTEAITEMNEATEVTTEAVMINDVPSSQKSNEKKTADKQPVFVENERRHYQEGELWKDDDEEQIVSAAVTDKLNQQDTSAIKQSLPLTKNSAFLIDMVMKYEGLIRRCPQYSFQQDENFVIFIIEVPHIFEESLWYAVYSDMLQFCCLSECVDDDMINSVFQLWIAFEKGYTIDPQKSRVDVSGNNAVFCLRKTKTNQTWHHIRAGFDKDNLDVRRFATTKNVCELYTLVFKHAEGVTTSPLGVCRVAKPENDLVVLEFEVKHEEEPKQTVNGDQTSAESAHPKDIDYEKAQDLKTIKASKPSSKSPCNSNKSVKFNAKVEKVSSSNKTSFETLDSDDDDVPRKDVTQSGIVTVTESDDSKEIISNHSTKSAVKLLSKSIYELDDDI